MPDNHNLSMAAQYVAETHRIIADQEGRIVRLRRVGADTMEAEFTLKVFQANLRLFEENLEWLKSSG